MLLWFVACLVTVAAASGFAQTRAAEIEKARDEKTSRLEPDQPSKWEQRLILVKDKKVLERLSAGIGGVRVKIGGMTTGSGFALGPDYLREDLARGELFVNASAVASLRQWYKLETRIGSPGLLGDRLFWDAGIVHHNYNSVPYYGPGPDSEKNKRTNYRYENTSADVWAGVKPHKWFRVGGSVGRQWVNIGPGQDDRYASTERVFGGLKIPGLDTQLPLLRTGVFAQFDYRDSPNGPRAGGNYLIRVDDFREEGHPRFRRLDMEVQQYIPAFNKRRVFAIRGKASQAFASQGRTVPFYHQAVLGGADDLRGFRPFRFQDDNLLLMNAEYRWEVFSGLDMAIFGDAGRVAAKRWQFGFSDLETAVGFGLRFNARNAPFLRIDVGFSHEGFQVFLKFNGIFADRINRASSPRHIY